MFLPLNENESNKTVDPIIFHSNLRTFEDI